MRAGKAMETLDGRESRSSLAGVFMAAALEGAGIYDFSHDLVPHLEGIPEQVEQVLSRVHSHGGLSAPAGLADSTSGVGHALGRGRRRSRDAAQRAGQFTRDHARAGGRGALGGARAAARRRRMTARRRRAGRWRAGARTSRSHAVRAGGHRRAALARGDRAAGQQACDVRRQWLADLKAGRLDPRLVSVLTAISRTAGSASRPWPRTIRS